APLPLARTRPAPTARERPFRIVLADDSVSVRKALGGILTRAGFEVALAADGEEAAVLLEGGPFDLLITDLEMPRRNGYELIAWLRRQPATARLPALVVTTRVGERHQELAFQVGATSCLSKPVGEDLLLRTAADLAARGRRSHA
ncbi:MAG TPA: hybrid sensor histidine kinase/response regulator, partial [Acidobacteria bacterium]|nr:hybrid sensor histidine kinase/response regulator [Acidobacteriota bacterium]